MSGFGESSPDESVARVPLSPLTFLRRSADALADKGAVVNGQRRYDYRELYGRVNRLASALRAAGLARHDRVAVLSPNAPALLEAHFGVPAAGGVLVAINVRLGANEVEAILSHSGARFLFVDAELERLAPRRRGLDAVRIDDTGQPGDPYEAFLATGAPAPAESWLEDEEEPISINYTSGTTGAPKGAVYSHRGAYLNALGDVIEAGLSYDSVYLWTLPMFHCNGWCFPWAVTAVAGRHVCLRSVDPERIWRLLDEEGVTHFCGAPTVLIGVVNHPDAHRLERRVSVPIGGAAPSPALVARMQELNLRPIHLYGLTETYGPSTVCVWRQEWDELPVEEQARRLARQGAGYVTGDQIRVVDEQLGEVRRDGETVGEVVVRGNSVMSGYFANPDATAEAFAGGWFHTGDLAVWHPDGYIELRDRKKDIIISGGENISTIEVEQTLVEHPAVLESAVVAVPHQRWGERPKAYVTLRPGTSATEQEIIEFCRGRLAHFKCPDAVEFGDLPKTSTGKVQKFVLREREPVGQRR